MEDGLAQDVVDSNPSIGSISGYSYSSSTSTTGSIDASVVVVVVVGMVERMAVDPLVNGLAILSWRGDPSREVRQIKSRME